jgi:hypothetical protein
VQPVKAAVVSMLFGKLPDHSLVSTSLSIKNHGSLFGVSPLWMLNGGTRHLLPITQYGLMSTSLFQISFSKGKKGPFTGAIRDGAALRK